MSAAVVLTGEVQNPAAPRGGRPSKRTRVTVAITGFVLAVILAIVITADRVGLPRPQLSLAPAVDLGSNSGQPRQFQIGIEVINRGKNSVHALGVSSGQVGIELSAASKDELGADKTVPVVVRGSGHSTHVILTGRITDCSRYNAYAHLVVRVAVNTWWGTANIALTLPTLLPFTPQTPPC